MDSMKRQTIRRVIVGLYLVGVGLGHAAITPVGNITSVTTSNAANGTPVYVFGISTGGAAEVTPYAPDVIRVRFHFTGLWPKEEVMVAKKLEDWPTTTATFSDEGAHFKLATSELDVIIHKAPFKVDFKDKSGFMLLQDGQLEYDPAYNYVGQRGTGISKLKNLKVMPAGQAYFGLGEYGGPLNRRGRELECWPTGTFNWGEFQNPTYMNMPFFYGVQPASGSRPAFVYGLMFNNPCRPLFKFGTQFGDRFSFEAGDGQLDYYFFGGGAQHTFVKVLDRYSELTGRPTFLPKWGLGHHLSRFSYDNQAWVEYIANEATVRDIPLDAVYLDIDYMMYGPLGQDNIRQLTMRPDRFPNPGGMLAYCHARGVKVIPLIEPWLQPNDPLYGEANSQFHFIKDNAGNTVTRNIYAGPVSWFDYSSTAMRLWWQNKIINWFNTLPFDGIWNDLTEPEGGDQIPHNGLLWVDGRFGTSNTDSRRWWSNEHNYFGIRAAQQSYDTFRAKYPDRRPFILGRSGTCGLQRYAVSWSGDTRANWFYQKATIPFGLSAMISGAGWFGHDVGGFAGSPDGELLVRSYEATALTPFFRNHANKDSADREPWRFGEPHQSMMRNIIKFRYRLMPYLYTLAYEFTQTGKPMNTPTVTDFYPDVNTYTFNDYDYMVGDYLLVAPVYVQGATQRTVYLPWKDGIVWYYWPTGQEFNGGQHVTVNAPLGTIPIFVRGGAIIPMGPSMQYVNQFTPNYLDINCWPVGTSEFTLYEDAGEGWDYLSGVYAKTRMVSVRDATSWQLTLHPRQGTYNPGSRTLYVYVYNPQSVQSVLINGVTIPQLSDFNAGPEGWLITGDGKLGIKTPDTGALKTILVNWVGAPPGGGADLGIPGTWSGWDDLVSPWNLGRINPPGTPAAQPWFTNTIYVATSGGDIAPGTYQFKLRAGHNWANNWGLNAPGSVTIDGATTLAWLGTTNASITVQSGFYYSFRVLQPTATVPATIGVFKTSARPVGITSVSTTPTFPTGGQSVTVNITLSGPKSPEERVFVRWTTNSWTSSAFVEATGSGANFSAVIPPMPNGRKVDYYVLTSTVLPTHSTADALTLALETNGGVNYTYTPSTIPWPGFGYPSDPAENIHHWKEEAVVGNGHITVMLDQNGTLYDIYFPSVGNISGTGTANEGYRGPQTWPPGCSGLDLQANGQMNLIAAMGGIAVPVGGTNQMHWFKNQTGTSYVDVGQRWLSDNVNIVVTSNRLNVAGYNIHVEQIDFVPSEDALPTVTDGTRTNKAVHIKRVLLTNREATAREILFYWDVNFNVKGDNAFDEMFWDTTGGRNVLIVRDNVGRQATGSWCDPNGYGGQPWKEYDPAGVPGGWAKSNSVYFATALKLVTNTVTGAGVPADGSWRDHTTIDHQEGWIGKRVTIPAGQTVEIDILIVGSWDNFAGATGTHAYWGTPIVDWFYASNMATVQAVTATYWSNWLAGGVTAEFPDPVYDRLFKRSLLVSKLHVDPVYGGIIAGMHNGAYPFVWPRDGVYAAITFDRTGHPEEARGFYRWLNNVERPNEPWGKGYFYQKYTTDGKPVWRSPQVDETASVPWGMWYHFLMTGDGAFLTNNWNLAYTSARASSEDSTVDSRLYFHDINRRMHSNNIWEDQWGEFLYSNASVVRGLRDAAAIASYVGQPSWATTFQARADDILSNGIIPRIDARVETSDISHLGLVVPFELFLPTDPRMTNMVEWLHGRQAAGGFSGAAGNLVEPSGPTAGWLRRYNHKTHSDPIPNELDIYWNGGPWTLANAWYGMYFTRWQDYVGGKSMVNTNKYMLDLVISKLGPMGLGAEQVAVDVSEQKYPDFWLQAAWPNVWESHALLLDQMMMFLDYRPRADNTVELAPKLPSAWNWIKFNNLRYRQHRFDVTVTESASQVRADINKRTSGALNHVTYLRIPAGTPPVMVITNGVAYVPAPADYQLATGRVRIAGPLTTAISNNWIVVTYGTSDFDGDGLSDSLELALGSNPLNPDTDGDGMPDGFEYAYWGSPTGGVAAADDDGDGMTNLQEYLAGTNPLDGNSLLRITQITTVTNGLQLTWTSVPSKTYRVMYRDDWVMPFTVLPGASAVPSAGTLTTHTDTSAGGKTNRFYRIELVLPSP